MRGRSIEKVKVFSPTVARRELYASEMSAKYDLEVKAAPSPDAAEEGVDIVIVATNTGNGGIAFEGKWMRKGMHVNSIVATMPVLREIDADSFARADSIAVDTMQIEEESGDVLDALKNGKYDRSKVIELKDLIGCSARDTAEQITLFKSVGTAVQDIMAGRAVFEEAKRLKLGTDVGDFLELKQMK